ncbi:MAG: M56 family metallopeptidase [Bacteroidales bacterium]|nr:M56 family metallopeptidase [Candidatus Colimorpha merdihippi]
MEYINYIFYVLMAMALFLLGYWLLMRHEVRHQMVRFYLLSTMVLSLLLPLVHLQVPMQVTLPKDGEPTIYRTIFTNQELVGANASVSSESVEAKPQTGEAAESTLPSNTKPSMIVIISWIYWLGVGVMALVFLIRLASLLGKLRGLTYSEHEGYRLAVIEGDSPAFSFGRSIVIGCSNFSDQEVEQLLGHELVHVRRHHTADVLLCEVLKVALWFNPFVWLYARELKRVHEYQADQQMVSGEHATTYLQLLYHQLSGREYSTIGNNFDYRITQKRIKMMKQHKTRFGSLSLLVALPVMALILFANCKQADGTTYVVDKIVMLSDDAESTPLDCWSFFDLENREFTFRKDGTMDVVCTVDPSVNFTGRYVFSEQDGLVIYDADGSKWLNLDCHTDYYNQDSIGLTFTDRDPVRGLSVMCQALSIKVFPTYEAEITEYDEDGKAQKTTAGVIDTTYPHVSIMSHDYDYMDERNWFLDNRLLIATNSGSRSTGVVRQRKPVFLTTWNYPTGVADTAAAAYDTITGTGCNPKRDDFQFHLQVKLKKK